MKKTFITLVAVAASLSLFAQQPVKDDAPTLLKKADEAVKKTDYKTALTYINQAKAEVNRLLGEQYLSVLPAKYGEYKIAEAQGGNTTAMAPGGGQGYTRTYTLGGGTAPSTSTGGGSQGGGKSSSISATISTNIAGVTRILTAHNPADEAPAPGPYDPTPVKIKGYKATQVYMSQSKMGTISILTGSAVVEVKGTGIDSIDELTKFIDLIDLTKLKTLSGD